MKLITVFLAAGLCAGWILSAGAQTLDDELYEKQLRPYSEFHTDFMSNMNEENEKKRLAAERLRLTGQQLKQEHINLRADIEVKETSIEKLKTLNEKLQAAQGIMYDQYEELEGLFKEQKEENNRLKMELETSKTAFHIKMLEFYQQEDAILTDKIFALEARQKEIRATIQELQESLEIE